MRCSGFQHITVCFDNQICLCFQFISYRPLKQSNSVSYDVPLTTSVQPRALSVDHTGDTKSNVAPPSQLEENQPTWNSTGISASSSEHDNQETNAWSSDYSNSEDEFTILEESAVPVSRAEQAVVFRLTPNTLELD